MRTNETAFLAFTTLAFAVFVTVARVLPPPPLPSNAPAGEFSAERTLRYIRAIATQPHPTGSAANDAVREYILAELKKLGLETETQRDGDLENVMGKIAGTDSSDAVLLTAHLDSTPQSLGAMDDASNVAALLETARILRTGAPLRNTVIFLFTDHEEGGFYGAKAFIARHPWAKDVKVVIGFDTGGWNGPAVLSATSANNGWLIRQLVEADPHIVDSSAINALADSSTDFGRAFKIAGFSGYEFDSYWDKGTGPDDVENLPLSTIQHQGYHALSLARHFGMLTSLADPKEPDAVYFSVLRLFTVHYSPTLAIALAIAVTGIFCGVLVYGLRRKILSWDGMSHGVFVFLAGLIAASLPGLFLEFILGRWIPALTADYDNSLIDQPFSMSIIALTTLTLTILWYFQSRKIRPTNLPDLAMGALVPMVAGMIATSIAFPALSYALTWPSLFSLLASVNWFYWRTRRNNSMAAIVGLILAGAITIIIVGPAILLGLFSLLLITLVSLGALCGFLVPQIHLILGYTTENPM
jgi:hypothetical protein